MFRKLIVLAVLVVLVAHFVGEVQSQRASQDAQAASAPVYLADAGFDQAHSDYDAASIRAFPDFPLYWVGREFEELPLTVINRRLDSTPLRGEDKRANYVSFVYGSCESSGEQGGCPAPLEIQVWPACERALADYRLTPRGDPLPHESLSIRGVPAAYFADGRLELYTGNVTVVFFGIEKGQLLRVASGVSGPNHHLIPSEDLPPPAPGALEGSLDCSQ